MIREYQTGDTDRLVEIWRNASAVAHAFLPKEFLSQEADNLRNVYLEFAATQVITENDRPVGFAAIVEDELAGLFVSPEVHGQGYGRKLVDHAVDRCGKLRVEVFERNLIGRKFYAAYGFVETGRSVHEPTGEVLRHLRL